MSQQVNLLFSLPNNPAASRRGCFAPDCHAPAVAGDAGI
jgi:hypothetical protein